MASKPIVGWPVENWVEPVWPAADRLCGTHVELHLLNRKDHAADLFIAFDKADALWTYLPYGPFDTANDYGDWID